MNNGNRYQILPDGPLVFASNPWEAVKTFMPIAEKIIRIERMKEKDRYIIEYVNDFGNTSSIQIQETLHGRPRLPGEVVTDTVRIPYDILHAMKDQAQKEKIPFAKIRLTAYRQYVESLK